MQGGIKGFNRTGQQDVSDKPYTKEQIDRMFELLIKSFEIPKNDVMVYAVCKKFPILRDIVDEALGLTPHIDRKGRKEILSIIKSQAKEFGDLDKIEPKKRFVFW